MFVSRRTGPCGRQIELTPCHGGYRPGAGRPRRRSVGIAHRRRPVLAARFPTHVTLRARVGLPSLRLAASRDALVHAIRAGRDRFGCRIVHYSIQSNHVHLLCEATDSSCLSRGLRGVIVRMARAFNRAHALCGSLWAERYHVRILRSPREVRGALVYVFGNWRHHGGERQPLGSIDPCSSAAWFDGFVEPLPPVPKFAEAPVAPANTWLLTVGYQRHIGKLSLDEGPWPKSRTPKDSGSTA